MRNMQINQTKIYIRPFLENTEGYGNPKYGELFIFKENIYPVNGESDIKDFGDRIFKIYKSTPNKVKWQGKVNEGDIAYFEGKSPDNEEFKGQNANYKITSVRETKNTLLIIFERT